MPTTSANLSVAQQLKKQTATAHADSENMLMPFLNSIRNSDDYARILKMFYGFFAPLENRIAGWVSTGILADIHERRNASLIIEDLKAIGTNTEELPLASQLPEINSIASALGAMYVLEGSTLGGRFIAKMLAKNEALAVSSGHLNFFNGYGEQTGDKWKSFITLVNNYPDQVEELIAAANETFRCMGSWMHQTLHHEN